MMIKIHKKGMAWLLMAGLVLGSLGGCQKKAGGTIEDTGKTKAQAGESGPGDGSTVLPSEEAKEPGAMGRYGETEIERQPGAVYKGRGLLFRWDIRRIPLCISGRNLGEG